MIDTTDTLSQRREPRYQIVEKNDIALHVRLQADGEEEHDFAVFDGDDMPVVVKRSVAGGGGKLAGDLLDVSRSGARLSVANRVPNEESIELKMEVADLDFSMTTRARVRWVGPSSDGRWIVGCSFLEPLAENVLHRLAAASYLERRSDDREPIGLAARIRRELEASSEVDVTLEDLSPGGFRMTSPEPAKAGQRILVQLKDDEGKVVCVPARAVWQKQIYGHYHIGCCFFNNSSFATLRKIAEQRNGKNDTKSDCRRRSLRLSRWGWLGLAAAILWLGMFAVVSVLNTDEVPARIHQLLDGQVNTEWLTFDGTKKSV